MNPMSDIKIEKLQIEEIDSFLLYFRKSIKELFPIYSNNSYLYIVDMDYGSDWLGDRLKKGGKRAYVAKDGDKIVGYLLAAKPYAGVAFADWLAVDNAFQKKGIASKFLSLWEKDMFEEGAHLLYLWTYSDPNIKFYKNRGFQQGGMLPKAWHGIDEYLMYKILREPKEENFLKSYLSSKKP